MCEFILPMLFCISYKDKYCFIINIIKVNTEYVKNQKYHVYKRIEKVYNNPHPVSGVV